MTSPAKLPGIDLGKVDQPAGPVLLPGPSVTRVNALASVGVSLMHDPGVDRPRSAPTAFTDASHARLDAPASTAVSSRDTALPRPRVEIVDPGGVLSRPEPASSAKNRDEKSSRGEGRS